MVPFAEPTLDNWTLDKREAHQMSIVWRTADSLVDMAVNNSLVFQRG